MLGVALCALLFLHSLAGVGSSRAPWPGLSAQAASPSLQRRGWGTYHLSGRAPVGEGMAHLTSDLSSRPRGCK